MRNLNLVFTIFLSIYSRPTSAAQAAQSVNSGRSEVVSKADGVKTAPWDTKEFEVWVQKRVNLCEDALKTKNWPEHIRLMVEADPGVGKALEIVEDCALLIEGKLIGQASIIRMEN